MTALPPIDPGYAAEVVSSLPSRLARKLSAADPSEWTITDTGEDVRVQVGTATVTITGAAAASCDCLLAPRCLHLASVLTAAPVAEDDATPPPATVEVGDATPERAVDTTSGQLSAAQLGCLELAQQTLTEVLTEGLTVLSAPVRAGILRVVALARAAGLHRLAATFTSLHTAASQPTERSVAHLRSAALAGQVLRHGHDQGSVDEEAIGTARRRYHDIGMQRLRGLACEPVLTESGYAGVVAHFVAEDTGQVWTVNAITPGDLRTIRPAYHASIELGQLNSPIADVVRSGLLLAPGTGSSDHRLGRGRTVRASLRTPGDQPLPTIPGWWVGTVRLDGLTDADPFPLLRLGQVDAAPPPTAGLSPTAWQLDPMAMGLLAGLAGDQVQVVLRADGAEWTLLAIDSPEWNLQRRPLFPGLEPVQPSQTGLRVRHVERPDRDLDFAVAQRNPEAVLARWSVQVALRGRRAVTGAAQQLARDQRWLAEHASPHRAAALGRLDDAARAGTVRFDGSFVADPSGLLAAWLAVSL